MQALLNYILKFGDLNEQQIALLESKITERTLAPDEYFSQAGKTPKEFGFVVEGVLRVFYFDKEANEVTKYFIDENNWVVDLNSFNMQVPSAEYIQAVTTCKLVVINRSGLSDLSSTIIQWDSIEAKMTSKALLDKVQRVSPMVSEDAKTRYLEFLKRFPGLANRIPLNHIASYIGITRSSLSRIRREIGEE